MTEHVIRQYEDELRRLRQMALTMGTLTGEQLDAALGAMVSSDTGLARQVVAREPDADRLEHDIDEIGRAHV